MSEQISVADVVVMANSKLINDIISRAEKNMTPSQVREVKKLIASVIFGKRYDRTTDDDIAALESEGKNEGPDESF